MEHLTSFFEKMAAKKNSFDTFSSNLSDDHKEDRELIKKVQMSGDRLAMKKLTRKYRGAIHGAVNRSQLSLIMDPDTAFQHATIAFNKAIKENFKLEKEVQPNTFIIGSMDKALKNVKNKYSDFAARKSDVLQAGERKLMLASNFLKKELDRDPTNNEILSFTNEHFGKTDQGKDRLTINDLKKIQERQRRELSADIQIGGKGDSSAEFMTLGDMKEADKITPSDIFDNVMQEQKVNNLLINFTRQERTFLRQYLGLGEFKGRASKSLNDAATSNKMTGYKAKSLLQKLKEMVDR